MCILRLIMRGRIIKGRTARGEGRGTTDLETRRLGDVELGLRTLSQSLGLPVSKSQVAHLICGLFYAEAGWRWSRGSGWLAFMKPAARVVQPKQRPQG